MQFCTDYKLSVKKYFNEKKMKRFREGDILRCVIANLLSHLEPERDKIQSTWHHVLVVVYVVLAHERGRSDMN